MNTIVKPIAAATIIVIILPKVLVESSVRPLLAPRTAAPSTGLVAPRTCPSGVVVIVGGVSVGGLSDGGGLSSPSSGVTVRVP